MNYYEEVYGAASESQKKRYSGLDTYTCDNDATADEIRDWEYTK